MKEPMDELALRNEMCDIGRRIWTRGFCAGNEGNHSVRLGADRVICTPSGLSKGFLRPEMMVIVDMDGVQVDGGAGGYRRTSEIFLHLAIYKKRADVGAVIHSHPPHATAFACTDVGAGLPEGIHSEAELFLGRVPVAPYVTPGTAAVGEAVAALVGEDTNTVLLSNHGTVSFAGTLLEAYDRLEIVDSYCRLLILIGQIGRPPRSLTPEQLRDLLRVKVEGYGMKDGRWGAGSVVSGQ